MGNRSNSGPRNEERLYLWGRLLRSAFWPVLAFSYLWAVPWLPFGLTSSDYSLEVTIGVLLFVLAGALRLSALLPQSRARRPEREASATRLSGPAGSLQARERLIASLDATLARNRKRHQPTAIAVLALDVPESVLAPGEEQGRLLGALGVRIRDLAPLDYEIGHLRSNEFGLLVEDGAFTEEDLDRFGAEVSVLVRKVLLSDASFRFVRPSVGIALSRESDCSQSELLRKADAALDRAKALGQDRHVLIVAPGARAA